MEYTSLNQFIIVKAKKILFEAKTQKLKLITGL